MPVPKHAALHAYQEQPDSEMHALAVRCPSQPDAAAPHALSSGSPFG